MEVRSIQSWVSKVLRYCYGRFWGSRVTPYNNYAIYGTNSLVRRINALRRLKKGRPVRDGSNSLDPCTALNGYTGTWVYKNPGL